MYIYTYMYRYMHIYTDLHLYKYAHVHIYHNAYLYFSHLTRLESIGARQRRRGSCDHTQPQARRLRRAQGQRRGAGCRGSGVACCCREAEWSCGEGYCAGQKRQLNHTKIIRTTERAFERKRSTCHISWVGPASIMVDPPICIYISYEDFFSRVAKF